MKTATISILLFLFISNAFCQNNTFLADKKKDSVWIKQLIEIKNKQQLAAEKKDTTLGHIEWLNGKVINSSDSNLRIAQITGMGPDSDFSFFSSSIRYKNRVHELKLPSDSDDNDFQDYPITGIYKLPNTEATYLVLSNEIVNAPNKATNLSATQTSNTDSMRIEGLYNIASLIHVVKDSLQEIGFVTNLDDNNESKIISGNSLYLDSYIKAAKNSPKPFLKYDLVKNEINFLTTYCSNHDTDKGCNDPFINVLSGTFAYQDTAFVLTSDTNYFFPSLQSLTKTIAIKKFKTGNYTTKVIATEKYEEVGEGVIPISYVDYYVQSQSIGYVDYNFDDVSEKPDLKPECKVQKDSGLIFLITDSTTPNHGGACGGAEYFDSYFWIINQNKKKLLFSFSSSSCNSYTSYVYNNGKSDISGKLYLENGSNPDETEWDSTVDKSYWKNNSTYVIRVSNGTLARNFYIHFITINKKTIANLKAGKLKHLKDK